jgi:acetyl esterase/lipase
MELKDMKNWKSAVGMLATTALLAACGGGGSSVSPGTSVDLSNARGSLVAEPLTLATLSTPTFAASVNAANTQLLTITGQPKCTISFKYFQYGTVGGANEPTMASAGIMVPSGTDPACQGPRPVLLYAHGTAVDKNLNMASPQTTEAALIAAMYAAQGYIVVAPNYAGYEASTLSYHPYLNADQQSKDMIDALTAARKSFPTIGANASSKLFVSGYSQGGHVAMATVKALQDAGVTVTASAPMSGPYNLGFFGDLVYSGQVNLGATIFSPLLTTSYQKAYGNIYSSVNDVYESTFATGIETLLPSPGATFTNLATSGKLPATFLFSGTPTAPQFAPFFGTPNLIKASFRNAVLADAQANPGNPATGTAPAAAHPLRRAAYRNSTMNFTLRSPMLLCGGAQDPTVFFAANTTPARAFFAGQGLLPPQAVLELNVDSAPTGATDPFALAKGGFALAKAAAADAAVRAGATDGGARAVTESYHGSLVPPFCNAAARGFFASF